MNTSAARLEAEGVSMEEVAVHHMHVVQSGGGVCCSLDQASRSSCDVAVEHHTLSGLQTVIGREEHGVTTSGDDCLEQEHPEES